MRGGYALTIMARRQPGADARRRAMVRLNGMMFYCTGIASFVESTAPLDTGRLLRLADGLPDVRPWVEGVWLPDRAARGQAFRDYIGETWPEFDWEGAYGEFRAIYDTRVAPRVGPPGLSLEFVARCVTETSLAVFYRTIAGCAEEPALRRLAARAAREHAAYFSYFRGLLTRVHGGRRIRFAAAVRAALLACRSAREVDVAAAFMPLGRHCHGGSDFPELDYAEFLARLAALLRRHGDIGPVERLLFRPWFAPAGREKQATAPRGNSGPGLAGRPAGPVHAA